MQAFRVLLTVILTFSFSALRAQSDPESIRKMEAAGDTLSARTALARAAENNPNSVPALTQYCEFLERYGDPAARDAYSKLLVVVRKSGDKQRAGVVARKLVVLQLLAGDRNATSQSLDAYR